MPTPKSSIASNLKVGIGCLAALIGGLAVIWVVTFVIGSVAGFIIGVFGGITNGILDALDESDFITWYFHMNAHIVFEPDYCFGDEQQIVYCHAWNRGAGYAVEAWDQIMLHQSARIVVAFIFPLVAAAITKKCIDEIWDSFRKKNQ